MTFTELSDLVQKQGEMIQTLTQELKSLREAPMASESVLKTVRHSNLYETIIEGTCSVSAGTETEHNHNLPQTPKRVIIIPTSGGVVYHTGTTNKVIKVKSTENSTTFKAYCII